MPLLSVFTCNIAGMGEGTTAMNTRGRLVSLVGQVESHLQPSRKYAPSFPQTQDTGVVGKERFFGRQHGIGGLGSQRTSSSRNPDYPATLAYQKGLRDVWNW